MYKKTSKVEKISRGEKSMKTGSLQAAVPSEVIAKAPAVDSLQATGCGEKSKSVSLLS